MADRVVILMHDLELAVRANAALEAAGFTTVMGSSFDDGRRELARDRVDLLLVTGALHEPSAMRVVQAARDLSVPAVGLAEASEPELAGVAVRLGLTAVLRKPVEGGDILAAVRRTIDRARLQERTGIIGNHPSIQEVLVKIEQMAPVSSTVLIEGESGTGKELVARAIHDLSPRRSKPFIAVSCAALPETLLESELFGHEKGAFTGAAERRLGRFELANGGTIFLDEVGELPSSIQVKLLRVLEERAFFRVGGVAPIKVDVRVIAATNRALKEAVAVGDFRDDLFYRLNVLYIYLPPLRERRSDIPTLVRRFIRELGQRHEREFRGITPEAMQMLVDAPWPGNVRQLRNLVESMVVLAPGSEIRPSDIPSDIRQGGPHFLPVRLSSAAQAAAAGAAGKELEFILRSLVELKVEVEQLRHRLDQREHPVEVIEVSDQAVYGAAGPAGDDRAGGGEPEPAVLYRPGMTMADVERATLDAALRQTRGNRRKAAELLGIGERTLYRKIKEYQLG